MAGKPGLTKDPTQVRKLPDNIRGIGYIFNWFPSTFKRRDIQATFQDITISHGEHTLS